MFRPTFAAGRTRRPALLLVLVLAPLALPAAARAAQITVTTTADELNEDGDCSLREAIVASNLNIARDACPAGNASRQDTISLASGATYSLTIPSAAGDTVGENGNLDIINNTAVRDLVVNVAGGGSATISQDATPDDRVFSIRTDAHVEMADVTIRGGFAPSGQNGAAIDANLGSSVKLERCVIESNVAGNAGGGILALGTALSLRSCVVRDNVAGGSGGAISVGGSTALTVDDTLFENNASTSGRGGAIHTTGTATITNSSFVNNDALDGGAIENITQTVNALKVSSSCFVGNRDVAVHTNVPVSQLASGNWWGVTTGPTADGDTAGPDIVTSGFLAAPPAGCRPQELVTRGNFTADADLPPRWRGRKLNFAAADGVTCNGAGCVLSIVGDGQRNQALQTLEVAGSAGDTFTLSARSSAFDAPTTAGKYLVELQLIHADGSKQRKVVKFSPGTHGFETKSKTLVAAEAYTRLKLRVEYGRATGAVDFDDVSVVLE